LATGLHEVREELFDLRLTNTFAINAPVIAINITTKKYMAAAMDAKDSSEPMVGID